MKTVFEKLMADRLKEVIIIKKTLLGTTRRWPRPLNRGGRSMEVLSLIIYTKYFWDFDMWPFNRGWPLNEGPLNRGSTVYVNNTLPLAVHEITRHFWAAYNILAKVL